MSTLAALPKVSNKKTSGVDIWIILAVATGIVVVIGMVISMHNINNTKQQMGSSFSTSDNFNK
jgi:flagellar basal body-associated protein FliL